MGLNIRDIECKVNQINREYIGNIIDFNKYCTIFDIIYNNKLCDSCKCAMNGLICRKNLSFIRGLY